MAEKNNSRFQGLAEKIPRHLNDIKLFANDEGIWRQNGSKPPFGIKWDEIFAISGYIMEYFDLPESEIEFDFEYGECFRINETWNGFNEVVEAIN